MNYDLEKIVEQGGWILGLKAGIGRTFQEAEIALDRAKTKKEKICPEDSSRVAAKKVLDNLYGPYAVAIYDSSMGLPNDAKSIFTEELSKKVDESIVRYNKLRYKIFPFLREDLCAEIGERMYDPMTGAYTPFGHLFEKRLNHESKEGIVVILDGNDMHYWNELRNAGYDDVSDHLVAIGRSLVSGVRKDHVGVVEPSPLFARFNGKSSRNQVPPDHILRSGYVSRTHGEAGDEFGIELFCDMDLAVPVVERLIRNSYLSQLDMYSKN